VALYSWFNRKENNLAITDNKQLTSNLLNNKSVSSSTSVWPTASVNSALRKDSAITQMTNSSCNTNTYIPLRLLAIKNI